MAGLEDAISGAPEQLSSMLDFKLPSSSTAVQSRREAVWYSGSGPFGPGAVRQLRFNLADSAAWLDPTSTTLRFKITNLDASNTLTTFAPAYGCIARVTIRSGAILEDLIGWNRMVYQQKGLIESDNENANMSISAGKVGTTIAAGGSEYFSFPLFSGIMGCGRLLSLRHLPLQVEVTLVSTSAEFCDQNFQVSDATLMTSLCLLDEPVGEGLHRHLQSGKSIQIPYSTCFQMQQAITNSAGVAHLSKAASRVERVICSFTDSSADKAARDFRAPTMSVAGTSPLYFTLGAKRIPEVPISGLDQCYMYLKQTLGPDTGPMDIVKTEYTTNAGNKKCLIGFPVSEMNDGTPWQGESMRGNQLCSLHWNGLGSNIDRVFLQIWYSAIASVSAEGCEVLD